MISMVLSQKLITAIDLIKTVYPLAATSHRYLTLDTLRSKSTFLRQLHDLILSVIVHTYIRLNNKLLLYYVIYIMVKHIINNI
jgi:hypothetical protein